MASTCEQESGENSGSRKKSGNVIKRKTKLQCAANTINKAFQTYGPQCPQEITTAMEGVFLPAGLESYVNTFAIRSEERALERMHDCPEFLQCASWSEMLDSTGFRETCNNEIPLALQTIAYTEKFPDADHCKGVDFQLLYLNLASMMMGQPVRRMNVNTQKLLMQVYEQTLAEASKTDNKEEIVLLQEKLKRMRKPMQSKSEAELMNKAPETMESECFKDPNINPLQLPIEECIREA
ncbi:AGAP005206-PA-like protein [Anopheles sinensis]|uniref:AGAP005206-PA-like protein n=1 Tax=Anopheles sinensis TaxID=74873 RepID=A0A084WKV4_ANOSI|nr:AGAP005206-PA-like protein [Anopheles sinensis]